ncbi:MAG TPA: N-acetylneuraminate synthase family protein [Candidatus Omnitrophota bacterium]|nr:N-acetylneuraminate synthase family protein [Candidatus Omnitrophota bacterium]HPD84108.1 N-acetylneuraminate synthase family protein [Candidatus Omnitrophota bacterium]HRZ02965.1 N-acetylneuraminate synthase family protein [Candidatus Omnitrophota bacterium]
MKIQIGKKRIGEGEPLYFIADIAANHDGDLSRALKLIDLAKEAGADAAKFQNFQASKIVSRKGFEGLGGQLSHQASWKKSVFEVYQDASLDFHWTEKLKKHCDDVGIEYMTSPYDFESVDHVDPYANVYKIGSGDITWLEIIEYIGRKGKPVILATGAASLEEVKRAMKVLAGVNDRIVLMQCNTNYTGSPENFRYINLNVLKTYAALFPNTILGLSDHAPGPSAVLGAVALGARVFEKHFTDDRGREGPDHKFSVIPCEWKEMVARADEVYRALGDGVKKVEDNEQQTSIVQKRALRYTRDLKKGATLTAADLFPLRPIPPGALPPYEIKNILGKKLRRDVQEQECVMKGDV